MMVAHILGIPVEESVIQLAPAAAATVTAFAIAGRTTLNRLRRRQPDQGQGRRAPAAPPLKRSRTKSRPTGPNAA
jgi:hypothetical protein